MSKTQSNLLGLANIIMAATPLLAFVTYASQFAG